MAVKPGAFPAMVRQHVRRFEMERLTDLHDLMVLSRRFVSIHTE
jgi:hypothetical protein